MKDKLLFVLPTLSEGGAEKFIVELACALSAKGFTVSLASILGYRGERGKQLFEELRAAGVVCSVPKEGESKFNAITKYIKFLLREKPSIVFATLTFSEKIALFSKFISFLNFKKLKIVRRLANKKNTITLIDKYFANLFDLTVYCSPEVKSSFENFVPNFSGSSVMITNGTFFSPLTEHYGNLLTNEIISTEEPKSFKFMHVGRMYPSQKGAGVKTAQKAHDTLILAFSKVVKEIPNTHLLLIGDGPLREELNDMVISLGIEKRVTFLGVRTDMSSLYGIADVMVFPSRFEGLPNVLIEAGIASLPVIASDINENIYIKPDKGWKICSVDDETQFASAMIEMSSNYEHYKSLAKNNSKYFKDNFSMEKCVDLYQEQLSILLK